MSNVQARREARRRKILENSETRLNRIKISDSTHSHIISKDTSIINNDKVYEYESTKMGEKSLQLPSPELTNTNLNKQKLIFHNCVIIVLAFIMRSMFFLNIPLVEYNSNNIFLPFFIYEITECVFLRSELPQGGLISILFLINLGLGSLPKLVFVLKITFKILQDLIAYFSSFICFDLFIRLIVNNLN